MSQRACPWQAFPAQSGMARSLPQSGALEWPSQNFLITMFLFSATWDQSYTASYGCNLHILIISQNFCPWQVFPAQSGKARSLPQRGAPEWPSQNFLTTMFLFSPPWGQSYTTFYSRNLWIFIISQSFHPQQSFPAQSGKARRVKCLNVFTKLLYNYVSFFSYLRPIQYNLLWVSFTDIRNKPEGLSLSSLYSLVS